MKLVKIMIAALACVAFLGACKDKKKTSPETKPLIVGTSIDNRPFEYYENGQAVGFDIELIHIIAQRLQRAVEIKDMSFDGLLGALQSAQVDMIVAAMTPSDERKKAVDFTQTYHVATIALVCLKKDGIQSLEAMKGRVVGAQLGTTHEAFAKEMIAKPLSATVHALPKIPDLIQELKVGRIAGIVLGQAEALAIVAGHTDMHSIALEKATLSGEAIALPKRSELTAKVDQIIAELKQDGTLTKLADKWLKVG
jgi:ABC-type amino acid transport substrate-binding protein